MMSDIIMRILLVDESERKTGFDSPHSTIKQVLNGRCDERAMLAAAQKNHTMAGARAKCQDDKDYAEMSNSSATGVSERRLCSTLHMIHCFVLRH